MNVIVDYILKSNDERVVVNDYIENDPLLANNLNKTLELANEFLLSRPKKSIWLYTGFTWGDIFSRIYVKDHIVTTYPEKYQIYRQHIVKNCDVLVDGQCIDSKRDLTLLYRGSKNQRLIDIQQSLQKGEIVKVEV